MKLFTELFLQLDRTNKTNEKIALLKQYFSVAPDPDKVWALALFTGRRPPRKIKSSQVQQWALELAGIPDWLFRESYNNVGDLAETVSLILPSAMNPSSDRRLSEWFSELEKLSKASDEDKKDFLINAWKQFSGFEIFVFNKLLMGSFRIGVSQTLVVRAIAEVTGKEPSYIFHRIMGHWDPFIITFDELIHAENAGEELSKPYPFYLAYAIEGELESLGPPEEWQVEWKWDGIRSQIILRNGELFIWSRGEELVTDKFPELHILKELLPDNTVLDGELICIAQTGTDSLNSAPETIERNWKPLPFNILQTRIGRKNVTKKILQEVPVAFVAYDVMEAAGIDVRDNPQEQRRTQLEIIYDHSKEHDVFKISPLLQFETWGDLQQIHARARDFAAEGFMLKRKNAPYLTGRKKGDWWKWKTDPLSVDAVMIYAMKGHGRRAEVYSDYTFAVWQGDQLIPFAKAYSGLTDKEINEVDRFVKQHTLEKFGPVRTVTPELVFEIGFEGINASTRHKSGIAVRFPRILRWRKDKKPAEADTLDHLKSILELYK
jgi:DNA ligase-1